MNKKNSSTNTYWSRQLVTREMKEQLNGHRSSVLLFTGLSGAGKSTLAKFVEAELHKKGCHTILLDGDNVRHGLCSDLNFSVQDRRENVRRIAEMASILKDSGLIVLVAFIAPLIEQRDMVKRIVGDNDYVELFCDSPIEICEERDTKDLYKKARAGLINDFTGISSPYEKPETAHLHLYTDTNSVDECVKMIKGLLIEKNIIW